LNWCSDGGLVVSVSVVSSVFTEKLKKATKSRRFILPRTEFEIYHFLSNIVILPVQYRFF